MSQEDCQLCKGTGWAIIVKDGAEFARKCQCQAEDTLHRKALNANIPPRFLAASLEWYKPDKKNPKKGKTQADAKKAAENFIRDYPAVGGVGLLFQGSIGLGKTTMLCTIGYQLIKKGVDVYYKDWNDLVREMRSGEDHSTRDFASINQIVNRLAEVDLLLFDELGASKVSPWVYDNIYYLFNRRYNNNKITVCATNYSDRPSQGQEPLNMRIGDRIRSRLFEMTEPVTIEGVDFRQAYG